MKSFHDDRSPIWPRRLIHGWGDRDPSGEPGQPGGLARDNRLDVRIDVRFWVLASGWKRGDVAGAL